MATRTKLNGNTTTTFTLRVKEGGGWRTVGRATLIEAPRKARRYQLLLLLPSLLGRADIYGFETEEDQGGGELPLPRSEHHGGSYHYDDGEGGD